MAARQAPRRDPRQAVRLVLRVILTGIVLLAPFKFGTLLYRGEIGLFPMSGWEWAFAQWPDLVLTVLSGIALLLALWAFPRPERYTRLWLVPMSWTLLLGAACAGLVRTTEWDAALTFLFYLAGVASYSFAVCWALPADPSLRQWLCGAVVVGTLLCCASGWRQIAFGGLKETLDYIHKMEQEQGVQQPHALKARLQQGRAMGPFVYPNSYAAHLLLVGPLLLLVLWRWGAHFDPVRLSQPLFVLLGAILWGGAFYMSHSRAAVVAVGGGIAVTACITRRLGRFRWLAAGLCLAGALAAIPAMRYGRGLASLTQRGHYYRAAVRMFAEHPVVGVGLGEFFPHYLRLKREDAEVARVPHNMVLNLASQAGILAALAALLCLAAPVVVAIAILPRQSDVDEPLFLCCSLGFLAWGVHALADFNLLIPGTFTLAAVMPVIAAGGGSRVDESTRLRPSARWGLALLGVFALGSAWRGPGEYYYQRLHTLYGNPKTLPYRFEAAGVDATRYLPLSPYPWLLLGRVRAHHGAWEAAVEAYERAVALAPHRSALHGRLAQCYAMCGRLQEAAAAAGMALEWHHSNPRREELQALIDAAETDGS